MVHWREHDYIMSYTEAPLAAERPGGLVADPVVEPSLVRGISLQASGMAVITGTLDGNGT